LWINTGEVSGALGIDDDGNGYADDVHGWSFIDGGSHDIDDGYNHGTHVAGIAAAASSNGLGIAGVCWKCRLMILKVLDSTGNGTYSDVAEAVMYAVNNGAKIINLSLGGTPYNQELEDAVEYAYTHNVLVVAAVGNYGGSVLYPAAYERTFAVAATDQDDQHASYSNRGPQVDVSAPGSSIYSTCIRAGYCTKTGTSMSTPHVSGLAGLIWSKHYTYTVSSVEKLIIGTAVDIQDAGWDEETGWGRIDAQRALSGTVYVVHLPLLSQNASFFSWPQGE
jgi:subtilisin family serine protease